MGLAISFLRRKLREIKWHIAKAVAVALGIDRNLIVFGARQGVLFGDCPREIMTAMAGGKYRCVWLTTLNEVKEEVASAGFECYLSHSARGVFLANRASLVVMSSQAEDIVPSSRFARQDIAVVFTGHGKSAKRTYLAAKYYKSSDPLTSRLGFPARSSVLAFAASELKADLITACYGIPRCKIVISGMPRQDQLFVESFKTSPRKVTPALTILYAPTWRSRHIGQPTTPFGYEDLSILRLHEILRELDIYIDVKLHPLDLKNAKVAGHITSIIRGSDRIRIFSEKNTSSGTYLAGYDALITDYSSIDDDFLIFNKPIIYAPYDLELFESRQGFAEDYGGSRAGPVALSYSEFEDHIRSLSKGTLNWQEPRAARLAKVHTHRDGKSTKRAVAHINVLMETSGRIFER